MSSTTSKAAFVRMVWLYYDQHGRHDLLWRKTRDPYHILVSELMLQQTQVARVIPKYEAFLDAFPTVRDLGQASLSDVLRLWQGLGYNRRARFLHEAAKQIRIEGFPVTYAGLKALPGVGAYTAGAVMAFAYEAPVPIIETNIRTVYLHHFYPERSGVTDAELLTIIAETLPTRRSVREWYYALMDYGAHLKSVVGNKNKQSRHYSVQSRFVGSDRQIRGAIIRHLTDGGLTKTALTKLLPEFTSERIAAQLGRLVQEGLVAKRRQHYELPT